MQSILQSLSFDASGTARLGPCPLGSVWTVLVSVPSASNSQSFEIFLMGTQVGSLQGTATYGPFQMAANQTVTVVSTGAALEAGQTVTVMGQSDDAANAPTGIFPVVSGGVVTTAGATPNLVNYSKFITSTLAGTSNGVICSLALPAGTWLINWQVEFVWTSSVNQMGSAGIGPSSGGFSAGMYSVAGAAQTDSAGINSPVSLSGCAIVTLAAIGTVYLAWLSQDSVDVFASDYYTSEANVTGLTAVQIG